MTRRREASINSWVHMPSGSGLENSTWASSLLDLKCHSIYGVRDVRIILGWASGMFSLPYVAMKKLRNFVDSRHLANGGFAICLQV